MFKFDGTINALQLQVVSKRLELSDRLIPSKQQVMNSGIAHYAAAVHHLELSLSQNYKPWSVPNNIASGDIIFKFEKMYIVKVIAKSDIYSRTSWILHVQFIYDIYIHQFIHITQIGT